MGPMGEALWGHKDSRLDKVSNSNHSGAWAGQWVKTRGFSKWPTTYGFSAGIGIRRVTQTQSLMNFPTSLDRTKPLGHAIGTY